MAKKVKILIVEDEPAVLMMMVYLLSRAGCEVLTARTGSEAIRLARTENPDLITLDIDLPEMNGFEICRDLKQDLRSSHPPVIFISGRINEADREYGFRLGAVDYIQKPFEASVFVSTVFSHIKANDPV